CPGAHLVRREKFASLVAASEFQRTSPSRSGEARTDARQRDGEMRAYLPERRLPWEELGFSAFFGAENRKPTIAQWSVFLPRLGRARRQASCPILSCRAFHDRPNCGLPCGNSALFDNEAINFLRLGLPRPAYRAPDSRRL